MFKIFQGRTNRATYWVYLLVAVATYAVIRLVDPKVTVSEVVFLFACVPRLHDIGRSGWWAGGVIFGELAVAVSAMLSSPGSALMFIGLYMMLMIGLMIALGCIPGQPDANRFGPPPKPGVSWKRTDAKADDPKVSAFD